MSDRIEKLLKKLSGKQREQLTSLIEIILTGELSGMDLKKLKGRADAYRVRKGDFRIIFTMKSSVEIRIVAVERRMDTTYNKL